jgi:hypothetical protein
MEWLLIEGQPVIPVAGQIIQLADIGFFGQTVPYSHDNWPMHFASNEPAKPKAE